MTTRTDVLVVGAGIVGTAVAAELAGHRSVHLLDAGDESLVGSTGHAPGFVGEFGGSPVATALATASTDALERLTGGDPSTFARTGCLEVMTTAAGAAALPDRIAAARAQGLVVDEIEPAAAARLAPDVVRPEAVTAAALFPRDAAVDATEVTRRLREHAVAQGVTVDWGRRVVAVDPVEDGVRVELDDGRRILAADVVVCTGIWAGGLLGGGQPDVPIVPVRHPYVHGPRDVPAPGAQPFVRMPEHHLYARWHGDRWGVGSYDHDPAPVETTTLERADVPWDGRFDDVIERGLAQLARPELFAPTERLDGIFALTPDNLPLVGRWEHRVWVAAAVWVTHAIGAAQVLAAQLTGASSPVPGSDALDPHRFAAWDLAEARRVALAHYRTIYDRG